MNVINLDSKRKQAGVAPATSSNASSLANYTRYFSEIFDNKNGIDDMDVFAGFFHYRVRYSNPRSDINGPERIQGVFNELLHRFESPRLIIRDTALNGQHGFVYWKFIRDTNDKRCPVVTGFSRIQFDGYGRVVSHRDVWDTGTAPRRALPRFRDWWRNQFHSRYRRKKPAAPPKEFHGSPPF